MGYVLGEPTVQQYFDANGDPLELGTIEFYVSGTSTPTAIYSDSIGTSVGTSVTLDSLGAPANSGTGIALFFDTNVVYKIVRKDAAGSAIAPTIDPYYVLGSGLVIDAVDVGASDSLHSYTGTSNNQQVQVGGYYTVGDGGGGLFYWDSSSSSADDGGMVILPTDHVGNGRWKRNLGATLNVRQYGAKGDGTTDDSAAISATLDYAIANADDVLFTAGQYRLASQIAKTGTSQIVALRGEGIGISVILVDNANGGISIENPGARNAEVIVSGLEFMAMQKGSGTALAVLMTEGGNRHQRSFTIEHCKFSVADENDSVNYKYFDTSLDITGAWRPYIYDVIVSGPWGPGISTDITDTSPVYKMLYGMNLDGCYGIEIDGCYIWSAQNGIVSRSAVAVGPEGFRMANTNIVTIKNGLVFDRVGREPSMWISDCHINYRNRGIAIDGCKLAQMSTLLMYNEDTGSEYSNPTDIGLDNTEKMMIMDSVFHFNGHPTARKCISIDASTLADTIVVKGNMFTCTALVAVTIGASATDIFLSDNEYPGPGVVATEIDDQSGNAVIVQRDTNTGIRGYMQEHQGDSPALGPLYTFYRNSISPAASDSLGSLYWDGNNSAGARENYGVLSTDINDATAGTEDGSMNAFVKMAGAITNGLRISDPTTAETAAWVFVDNGTTRTLKRVSIGTTGSGGAGYRLLRVAN